MIAQEIKTLPTDEKVRIMEAIWEDMRDHYEEAPISQEVIDLLKEPFPPANWLVRAFSACAELIET